MEDELLAKGLVEFYEQGEPASDNWAWDQTASLLSSDPERLWRILQRAMSATSSDDVLERIGESHLESLIAQRGPEFVDRIIDAARNDERLETALRCAWGELNFDPDVLRKINAFLAERGQGG
jgi:hypothetical protein